MAIKKKAFDDKVIANDRSGSGTAGKSAGSLQNNLGSVNKSAATSGKTGTLQNNPVTANKPATATAPVQQPAAAVPQQTEPAAAASPAQTMTYTAEVKPGTPRPSSADIPTDPAAAAARDTALQELLGRSPDVQPFTYEQAPEYTSQWQNRINGMMEEILGRPGFSYDAAPEYTSRYGDRIDELSGQIMGRDPFSYDLDADPLYQQYRQQYTRNGQQAMRDTMGQAAALTGGYGSTYAQNVGQQAYNGYMQQLNDRVPELEQLAYEMWLGQGDQMRQNLSMLQGLEDTDYARYGDRLNQYNANRNFDYGRYMDEGDELRSGLAMLQGQEDSDYGRYADRLGQYNANRSFDYGTYADARDYAYQQARDEVSDRRFLEDLLYDRASDRAGVMAQYGDFSDFEALGYTPAQIDLLRQAWDAQWEEEESSGGGGGGGRRSTGDETEKSGGTGSGSGFTNNKVSDNPERTGGTVAATVLEMAQAGDRQALAALKDAHDQGLVTDDQFSRISRDVVRELNNRTMWSK